MGFFLFPAGLGVAAIGVIAARLELVWAREQQLLGLFTVGVAYYLATMREHLRSTRRGNVRTALHRAVLAFSLVGIAAYALLAAQSYRPPSTSGVATATRVGMWLSAVLAAFASLIGAGSITVLRHLRRRSSPGPRTVGPIRRRLPPVCWAMTFTGLACGTYATTHLVAAYAVAPTVEMQVAQLFTAAMLIFAALYCFHDPLDFRRLVFGGWS